MYSKIDDFIEAWKGETEKTQRMLDALTDASLGQSVCDGHRTLGRVAWHIVTTIPEMMTHTGLKLDQMLDPGRPVPATAKEIAGAYRSLAATLEAVVSDKWDDKSLFVEDDLYGQRWQRRFTLMVLVQHQIHHRGQMTVLMRQAGIQVPGVYGPAKEDWAQYGAPAPEI